MSGLDIAQLVFIVIVVVGGLGMILKVLRDEKNV